MVVVSGISVLLQKWLGVWRVIVDKIGGMSIFLYGDIYVSTVHFLFTSVNLLDERVEILL